MGNTRNFTLGACRSCHLQGQNLAPLEAALAVKQMQFKTNLAQFKAELEDKIKKITGFIDFINSHAALSTAAVPEDPLQETSHAHVFKH